MGGDLPKRLVQSHCKELAIPLTAIFNHSFLNRSWPSLWKMETVIPIPKIPTPGSFNDLRPISMSTLWSKLMESYVASYTLIETGKFWKKNQHGGKRGSVTDHVLVSLWDSILSNLDDPNILATTLVGVDFSKSFSRCSFQQILLAYKDLNASQWCIDMHAAFLTGRHMQVKVGNVLSEQISVSGGAVQGSILGVLDHNAVLENIDNEFVLPASKYVDDFFFFFSWCSPAP